ncbi:sulfotransferase domain-containing protein [Limibacillus sp. MBR-115]|jgi:hypothetical protein|uniref:sulfotransferase domain-containing protein n=1 Tax=Limibacillus sp. MBR-115 TaxID=3156465 RepID=UPI00339B98C6
MAKILWLASYPKSGNTWLRTIVDRLLSQGEALDLNLLPPSFNGATNSYIKDRKLPLAEGVQGAASAYWRDVQAFLVSEATRDRVFMKTHNIAARFGGVPFPDSEMTEGAIYVVRDPRDVAISYSYHFQCGLADAVAALCNPEKFITRKGEPGKAEMLGSWGLHVKSWTQQKRFPLLLLRYEDMHTNPAKSIATISRTLGFSHSMAEIARVVEETSFSSLKEAELRGGFKEAVREGGFFRKGRAKQWQVVEDQGVFAPITTTFGPLMEKLGYSR